MLRGDLVTWDMQRTTKTNHACSLATVTPVASYATLREIEDRLKSIRNIEKITKTMKIVASTKLNRAQRAMFDSRNYGETSNEVFNAAETKPLDASEDKNKTLLVVCSSDKGLCGGIHSGLSRTIRKLFAEQAAAGTASSYDLVILGEKCKAQLQRTNGKDIALSFAGVGRDIPTFAEAQAIADQIVQLPSEYSSIRIIYNKFVNAQTYEATTIEAFSEEAIAASRMSSKILCFASNGPSSCHMRLPANISHSQLLCFRGRRSPASQPPRVRSGQLPLLGSG